jgi:diaminohydroxyphosphoribosylaminopyrimidine deaminase/5-amino-6-(5-phosphoribosylamino)uracil reductase
MVGAVVVSPEGVIVGQGFHECAGEAHAEVRALDMAGSRAKGSTLYCTLEPCSHTGRTGPCAPRVVEAGVSRVVAALEDPNPLVSGRGFAYLREHGVSVEIGVGSDSATKLNLPYLTLMTKGRPFVTLKAAISIDGCLAGPDRQPIKLTAEPADRHAHSVRAEVDAIGVGVGTILADDPLLTPRGVHRARPLVRVVFDRRLRTPPGARLLSTREAGPVIIVTTEHSAARADVRRRLEDAGAEVDVADGPSLRAALARLGLRQVGSLLLEGGATLHRAAWNAGLADFVRIYVTPHRIGASGLPFLEGENFDPADLLDRRIESLGPDVLMEGYVHRPY